MPKPYTKENDLRLGFAVGSCSKCFAPHLGWHWATWTKSRITISPSFETEELATADLARYMTKSSWLKDTPVIRIEGLLHDDAGNFVPRDLLPPVKKSSRAPRSFTKASVLAAIEEAAAKYGEEMGMKPGACGYVPRSLASTAKHLKAGDPGRLLCIPFEIRYHVDGADESSAPSPVKYSHRVHLSREEDRIEAYVAAPGSCRDHNTESFLSGDVLTLGLKRLLEEAEQGELEAMYGLSSIYESGVMVAPDPAEAYFWHAIWLDLYECMEDEDPEDFAEVTSRLKSKLDPSLTSEGGALRKRVDGWLKKHPQFRPEYYDPY